MPAEFTAAIAQEANLKRYQDQARTSWDSVGRSPALPSQPSQPLTQHEYRQRQVFVSKVKEFWVEGFLKRSLVGEAIELGLQARPDAVQRPFAEIPAELDQGVIIGLIGVITNRPTDIDPMTNGLIIGLISLPFFGLRSGGAACIQHFNLRFILYRADRIPWNYAQFLDFASDRLLLKKVGGGYLFYHRMLMEHMARSEAAD